MKKTNVFASLLLVLAVLFMQVGNVAAAPQTQGTTPITGTIQTIDIQTDAVVVTLLDSQGATQTVHVSLETAVTLGLVTLDPATQKPVVDQTKVGQTVNLDPTTVLPEEANPVATALGDFFNVEPSVIEGYHEDGFGFGVIAQALWMSKSIGGDASLAGDILEAKQNHDFSQFTGADGSPITNWGQFKKAILKQDKGKHNLGVVVSGHGNNDENSSNGNGNGKDKGNNGKGKGQDKKNNP